MDVKVGDRFYNPDNGTEFEVVSVSRHNTFFTWQIRLKGGDWSIVMNPVDVRDLENSLKARRIIIDTEAGRLFYDKK